MKQSAATFFALSLRDDADDRQAIVVAQDPAGPIRQNVATPARNVLATGTITHQHSEKTTIAVGLSYRKEAVDNQGVGGFTLQSAAANWNQIEQEATYTQQTVLTATLLHQFRLLLGNEWETQTSISQAPSVVVLDAFTGGGAQGNAYRTEHHFTLTDSVTWSPGRHVIKTGLNIPDWSRRRYDDNMNSGGTFYFSGVADYVAGRPFSFIQQVGNGHVAFLEKQVGGFVQDEIRVRPNVSVALGLRYDWQNYVHDTNNFAPRASFAFAPTGSGRTVIRGGAGMFYDRTGVRPIQDVLRYNGVRLLRYVIVNPGYPNPLESGQGLAAQPPSIVTFAPDLNIPWSDQYSLSLERQILKRTSVSVTYTGSRGFDQFRSRDINAPLPPLYLVRPNPALGVSREIESAGTGRSQSLQLTLRGQVTRFFSGSVQYVLSRAMNDTGGLTWMPPNSYDLSQEYARADFDQRHRFDLLGTFNPGSLFNVGVALALYSGKPVLDRHRPRRLQHWRRERAASRRPAKQPRRSGLRGSGSAVVARYPADGNREGRLGRHHRRRRVQRPEPRQRFPLHRDHHVTILRPRRVGAGAEADADVGAVPVLKDTKDTKNTKDHKGQQHKGHADAHKGHKGHSHKGHKGGCMRKTLMIIALAASAAFAVQAQDGPYRFVKEIKIGGEGGWDYLSVDSAAKRLYVSHATKAVVIDLSKDAVAGEIPDTPGIHGAIAVPGNRIFTSNGRGNNASIVDAKTLQLISKVETGANPDGIIYEPKQKAVWTFNGRSSSATVIDAASGKVTATIPLGGKPEAAVSDGAAGRVYVNLEDKNTVAVVDLAKHEVVANWPIAPGEEASGLAIDLKTHRLFIGASNKLMLMMDSTNGKIVGQVPIGPGVDSTWFNPQTGYAFSSCGDGTTTIAHEDSPDKLTVVQVLKTGPGARTMALDTTTHRIYLASAEFNPPPAGAAPGRGRPTMVANSMKILVFGMNGK